MVSMVDKLLESTMVKFCSADTTRMDLLLICIIFMTPTSGHFMSDLIVCVGSFKSRLNNYVYSPPNSNFSPYK